MGVPHDYGNAGSLIHKPGLAHYRSPATIGLMGTALFMDEAGWLFDFR